MRSKQFCLKYFITGRHRYYCSFFAFGGAVVQPAASAGTLGRFGGGAVLVPCPLRALPPVLELPGARSERDKSIPAASLCSSESSD